MRHPVSSRNGRVVCICDLTSHHLFKGVVEPNKDEMFTNRFHTRFDVHIGGLSVFNHLKINHKAFIIAVMYKYCAHKHIGEVMGLQARSIL